MATRREVVTVQEPRGPDVWVSGRSPNPPPHQRAVERAMTTLTVALADHPSTPESRRSPVPCDQPGGSDYPTAWTITPMTPSAAQGPAQGPGHECGWSHPGPQLGHAGLDARRRDLLGDANDVDAPTGGAVEVEPIDLDGDERSVVDRIQGGAGASARPLIEAERPQGSVNLALRISSQSLGLEVEPGVAAAPTPRRAIAGPGPSDASRRWLRTGSRCDGRPRLCGTTRRPARARGPAGRVQPATRHRVRVAGSSSARMSLSIGPLAPAGSTSYRSAGTGSIRRGALRPAIRPAASRPRAGSAGDLEGRRPMPSLSRPWRSWCWRR